MSETTTFLNHKQSSGLGVPDYDNSISINYTARTFWTPNEPGYLQINSLVQARRTYIVSENVAKNSNGLTEGNLDKFVVNDSKTILVGHSSIYSGGDWATYDCNFVPIVPGQYIYATAASYDTNAGKDFVFIPFKK